MNTSSITCVVSSFAPSPCGIATYAQEQVERLVENGTLVVTITMRTDSQADHHFDFADLKGLVRWLWFCLRSRFGKVYLHYTDNYFFPRTDHPSLRRFFCRFLQAFSMRILGSISAGESHIIIHEMICGPEVPLSSRLFKAFAINGFSKIEFHTAESARMSLETYPFLNQKRFSIIDHAHSMRPKFAGPQMAAREKLLLQKDGMLFLCAGMINRHKGFDRAVAAFLAANVSNGRLAIVGWSTHSPQGIETMECLREQIGCDARILVHDAFVSDEDLDCWLQASDAVILPYRGVNSSGIGARAGLFGKKLIISDLPNLREQFPEGLVFADQEQLVEVMRVVGGRAEGGGRREEIED